MRFLSHLMVLLVVLVHLWFMALEMLLWNHPVGQRIFEMTPEFSASSAVLAANQGLYNGFLAAGLVWGLLVHDRAICVFFLGCVVIAGLFGAWTVKRSILFVQAVPAVVAAVAVHYL